MKPGNLVKHWVIVKCRALVKTMPKKVEKVENETLRDTLGDAKPEILVETREQRLTPRYLEKQWAI